MRIWIFVLLFGCSLALTGCFQQQETNGEQDPKTEVEEPTDLDEKMETPGQEEENKEEPAKEVAFDQPKELGLHLASLLQKEDLEALSKFVHPSKGVRFSPYAYVHVDQDLVFRQEQVKQLFVDEKLYHWGYYDGKGTPIKTTFREYFERFVYDEDYANAEKIVVNERIGPGSTLDNSGEIYPEATIVEFHFSGFDPQFDGMDWRSLRLVLEQENGTWYLVGIIHDEWTI